jgi:hypothetical protein
MSWARLSESSSGIRTAKGLERAGTGLDRATSEATVPSRTSTGSRVFRELGPRWPTGRCLSRAVFLRAARTWPLRAGHGNRERHAVTDSTSEPLETMPALGCRRCPGRTAFTHVLRDTEPARTASPCRVRFASGRPSRPRSSMRVAADASVGSTDGLRAKGNRDRDRADCAAGTDPLAARRRSERRTRRGIGPAGMRRTRKKEAARERVRPRLRFGVLRIVES